jgi:hypothetical protein
MNTAQGEHLRPRAVDEHVQFATFAGARVGSERILGRGRSDDDGWSTAAPVLGTHPSPARTVREYDTFHPIDPHRHVDSYGEPGERTRFGIRRVPECVNEEPEEQLLWIAHFDWRRDYLEVRAVGANVDVPRTKPEKSLDQRNEEGVAVTIPVLLQLLGSGHRVEAERSTVDELALSE